jgi:serine/threonine protein kinase
VLGDGVVLSDTRSDPPLEVALACLPGLWHAWVRTAKNGARASLMAVHEAHLARANAETVTFGGDIAAYLVGRVRDDGVAPTGDWAEIAPRVGSDLAELVRECAAYEPEFVSRWGGGPVTVMVSDEDTFDPARRPSATAGDAGLLGAAGCWARTSTDDNWSIYGVEHEDKVIVLRIRCFIPGHRRRSPRARPAFYRATGYVRRRSRRRGQHALQSTRRRMPQLAQSLRRLIERPEPERRLGPFVLLEQLGRGSFAPVWLAREIYGSTEIRTAAVKLFALDRGDEPSDAVHRARIIEEARSLCQVEHPNVVRFYSLSIDEARGVMGLAMEHVAGTALDRRLEREGRLPVGEALAVGTALASALAAVHQAGLVHRDVKPANVIEAADVYKLIDFGVASASAPSARESERAATERPVLDDIPLEGRGMRVTELDAAASLVVTRRTASTILAGFVCGTLGYIDPVCIEEGAPADAASDLYALGATLFECLAGSVPAALGAPQDVGLRGDVLDGRSPAPPLASVAPDVPPALARLIDSLLALKRDERPVSAEQVAIELDRIRSELAGRGRALPPSSVGPFRGLGRFEEGDRDVHFGRGSEVAAALEMLRSRGLVALVGPSGSGKSSLARAGVLPAVAEGALGGWPTEWDRAICEPGDDPRGALAASLMPFVPDAGDFSPDGLVSALAERVRATARGILLLVDQLEELATRSAEPGRAFLAALLGRLGERPLPGVRVLVTARRDLLGPLIALGPLGKALIRGSVLIEPMTALAWATVLDQALAAYGYSLEDEALRGELAAEIEETASAMPLLQFALTELWDKRDQTQKKVTRGGLLAIGGLAGALERHAERTLAALDGPRGREAARAVLLALTTPQGTRASRRRDDLAHAAGAGGEAAIVALEQARLILAGEEGVTLAHEALLTQWARLRAWLAEARDDRVLAEELERDAARWRESPDLVALWRKHRLAFVEGLRGREHARLSEDARAFLSTSRRAERRARLVVMASLSAVLLGITAGVVLYVRAVQTHEAATREALEDAKKQKDKAEGAQQAAEREQRSAQEKQAEIERLVKELGDAPTREDVLALKQQVQEAKSGALGREQRAGPPPVKTAEPVVTPAASASIRKPASGLTPETSFE